MLLEGFFGGLVCWGLNCVPPKCICWRLTCHRDCIWWWDLQEVIKVKWAHEGGAWSDRSGVLVARDTRVHCSVPTYPHWGKARSARSEMVATKSREESSREGPPCRTVVSDILPPEQWENPFLLFEPQAVMFCYNSQSWVTPGSLSTWECSPPFLLDWGFLSWMGLDFVKRFFCIFWYDRMIFF